MPRYSEKRKLPYTPEQLFGLVADVERYHEFLPWCVSCRVTSREHNAFHADLVIGYKMIRERFTSRVILDYPAEIRVEYQKGPMRHLSNHWRFIPESDGSCTVDFFVDFEFKNAFLQNLMGVFFNEIVRRMVAAFEARANALYGSASAFSPSSKG